MVVVANDKNVREQLFVTSFAYLATTNSWIPVSDIPFIRLSTAEPNGIRDVSLTGVQLLQNVPNPFTRQTVINYQLEEPDAVTLEIHDLTGRLLATYGEGVRSAGANSFIINADALTKGIYFYSLKTKRGVITKKMIVE